MADLDDEMEDLNIYSSQISNSSESIDITPASPAHEVGQSYYHPANLIPQLFHEDTIFFARPSNTLGLWMKLVRDEPVSAMTDQDPKR